MSRLLVVCAKRYNGHELWTMLGVVRQAGHTFEVVSQDTLIRDELTLRPNTIKRKVWEVDPSELDNYDGIVIVSGNMKDTEAYWDDRHVLNLIEASAERGKLVAAICCSVPTIRTVAHGKAVSFYPLVRSRERLTNAGAILRTVALTVDGKLVTAEHQMATQMWAEEIVAVLEGKPPIYELRDSQYTPQGNPRKPIEGLDKIRRLHELGRTEGTRRDDAGHRDGPAEESG